MEQRRHKKPAANTAATFPASSGSSSFSRPIHGSMSSAFLGVSSSSSTHSQQRRSSPSLYPPPAPLPRHLASRGGGSAASGGSAFASASGSSSSHFNQISPSPAAVPYRRRPRPNIQRTHSLPTPFLSELSSIRRMGRNLFGDLDAQEMTQRPLLHGQQEQEMTRSSLLTMSRRHTPIPSGEFSGSPSSSQQQQQQPQSQPSFSSLQPLPGGGNFSGFPLPASQQQQPQPSFNNSLQPLPGRNFSGFPFPASQQQQPQPSSSTGGLFSGFEPPVASQHLSTYLAPIPSWSTIFQSSSCSSDLASRNGSGDAMAMHGRAQPSSDTELAPLPPSLQIRQYDLPPLGQLTQNNGSCTESGPSATGFVQHSSDSEMYELAPLPESLQMPPLLLQQVTQDPVAAVAPCLDPQIISLDDDDELSALVHSSFGSSSHGHGSASLPMPQQPSNIEHSQQLRGSGSGLMSMNGALQGGGQTWPTMPVPASVNDTAANNGGGSSSSTTIPWNGHGTMPMMYSQSQQQALQQLSDLVSLWSSTVSSSSDQSTGSSIAGSCQGWEAMTELVSKFDMMSIGGCQGHAGGSMSSSSQEGWLEIPAAASSASNYVPKLILGGMDKPGLPPRSPALGAGTSSSMFRRGGTFFSEAEMEKIHKDNGLNELIKIDPKRVKRILNNRVSSAKMKVQEANYIQNLQSRADALKMECSSLSTQVQSHKEMLSNLETENHQMLIKLNGLKEQDNLSQALNNQLASEVQRLKLLGLNMLSANGIHHPNNSQMAGGGNNSPANDLHQLMNSDANGLIGSHQLQTHGHTPQLQLEQQAHQAIDDEIMGQPPQQ